MQGSLSELSVMHHRSQRIVAILGGRQAGVTRRARDINRGVTS